MNQPDGPERAEMNEESGSLAELASSLNEKLETRADAATNQAFNLGCFVGIVPLLSIVIATYFLTGRSWVGAAVMFVLMVLGLVLFANVVAAITRKNTLQRTYHDEIRPQIDQALYRMQRARSEFDGAASEVLAPGAALRIFMTPPASTNNVDVGSTNQNR
jgi:hypothetical protein